MEKMKKIARGLDLFLRITYYIVFGVGILLAITVPISLILFWTRPELLSSVTRTLQLANLELTIAPELAADLSRFRIYFSVCIGVLALGYIAIIYVYRLMRRVLGALKEGEPFGGTVSRDFFRMGWFSLIWGVLVSGLNFVTGKLEYWMYDGFQLLLSDKITEVSFSQTFDLDFLLAAAVFFLLGYIFRYGETLQQLADETL